MYVFMSHRQSARQNHNEYFDMERKLCHHKSCTGYIVPPSFFSDSLRASTLANHHIFLMGRLLNLDQGTAFSLIFMDSSSGPLRVKICFLSAAEGPTTEPFCAWGRTYPLQLLTLRYIQPPAITHCGQLTQKRWSKLAP
jgi:hypothetical protein